LDDVKKIYEQDYRFRDEILKKMHEENRKRQNYK
jgi:hypothetical protein